MNKFLCIFLTAALWASTAYAEVSVFAAASMKEALDQIGAAYNAKTGHKIIATYAASGALARQIEQGSPADVFISADDAWMDELSHKDLIKPETRHVIAGNVLVLIGQVDQAQFDIEQLPQLLGTEKLALGDVTAVPAGKYAKAALQNLKLWDAVFTHVVMQDNVRSALALVARGEAKFGVVYASDAKADERVKEVATFPSASHPPIHFLAAVVTASTNLEAKAFNDFLSANEAQGILSKNGFITIK